MREANAEKCPKGLRTVDGAGWKFSRKMIMIVSVQSFGQESSQIVERA